MLKKCRKLWVLFLSVALIVTQLPVMAMAENNVPENGNIVAVKPSDSSVEKLPVLEIEPLLCTKTEDCSLMDGHEGECTVPLPANGSLVKTISSWTFVPTEYSDYVGGEFAMSGVSMEQQADFDVVVSMLPTQISAELENEADPATISITGWVCPEYRKDGNDNWPLTGEYTFTAVLPAGYDLRPAPAIRVLLGGAQTYDNIPTVEGDGYSFNPNNGELTIWTNEGTTNWHNKKNIKRDAVLSLSIDSKVTEIDNGAFVDCVGLKKINLSNLSSLNRIGGFTFSGCTGLERIDNLPSGLTSIGMHTFSGCTGLKSIANLPSSLMSIGTSTFSGCTGLESIDLSNLINMKQIGESTFKGCTSLESIDNLPSGLTSIGKSTFEACTGLKSIDNLPSSLTEIGMSTFYGCTGLKSIDNLPSGLTEIGMSTFYGCTGLEKIDNLPPSLTSIGVYMFKNCTNLKEIVIPQNVASIGESAFQDTKLKNMVFLGIKAPKLGEDIFSGISPAPSIYTPIGSEGYDSLNPKSEVPAITGQPQTVTITPGSTANFTVMVTTTIGTSLSFQWQVNEGNGWKDVANGTGGDTNSYTTAKAQIEMNGWQYRCMITTDIPGSGTKVPIISEAAAVKVLPYSGGSSNSVYEPKGSYEVTGDKISQNVSSSDLKKLADASKSLTLSCDKTSMTFDSVALKAILAAVPATADNITFASVPVDLSGDVAELIGSRPVYDFTISYKDSKGNPIIVSVDFPTGSVSIAMDYTPAPIEVPENLFMVYVDSKGTVTRLNESSYVDGKVLAKVSHFSTYGIAYKVPMTWSIERCANGFRHHWSTEIYWCRSQSMENRWEMVLSQRSWYYGHKYQN